jgi:hypothetical protein
MLVLKQIYASLDQYLGVMCYFLFFHFGQEATHYLVVTWKIFPFKRSGANLDFTQILYSIINKIVKCVLSLVNFLDPWVILYGIEQFFCRKLRRLFVLDLFVEIFLPIKFYICRKLYRRQGSSRFIILL